MLKIGADPELFVFDTKNNVFVSAHDLIPGTKKEPFKVKYGAVQVDGVAAEFNIDPVDNVKDFIRNLTQVRAQLEDMIKAKNPAYKLVATPVAHFTKEYFDSLPDSAKELGCDPDFNAWFGGKKIEPPDNKKTFRTGSGHIHLGWTEGADPFEESFFNFCCKVVKTLDNIIGIPSLIWDKDKERRVLYGKAGAFRPKPYGLEYRVLSNKWLDNEKIIVGIFSMIDLMVRDLEGKRIDSIGAYDLLRLNTIVPVQGIINREHRSTLDNYIHRNYNKSSPYFKSVENAIMFSAEQFGLEINGEVFKEVA